MNDADKLRQLVAKFPTPSAKDGKLAEVDKDATDAAVSELVKGGKDAVVGLVGMLTPAETGGDGQVRHALHALVIHAGGAKDGPRRALVAEALASTLAGDRPADVKAFVLRELELVGGKEVTPAVGKLLTDEAIGDDAARTLLAIKDGAAEQFRAAFAKAKGRQVVVTAHALGVLRDDASADALRKLLDSADRDARLTGARALANLADATSAERLLKMADAATGYERAKLTDACLSLAEQLSAAGKKKEAAAVYTHLQKSRTEAGEKYVRDAAERGLAAAK